MIPNWIEQRATLTPNKTALTFQGESWSYEQLSMDSKRYASVLQRFGLTVGKRVAVYGKSTPELIKTVLACMQIQMEFVLLNLRLTAAELAYQIEDSAVEVIIVADELVEQLPATAAPTILFSTLAAATEEAIVEASWERAATMTIMYTSGTTSLPKGVRQTVGNHLSSATSSLYNTGMVAEEAWICAVPIFHISGFSMLCKCILHGVRLDLYEKFEAGPIAQQLIAGTATRISVVAFTLEQLLTHIESLGARVSPKFQLALAGGGPIPVEYLKRAEKLQLKIAQTYGMTETSSQTATLATEDALRKIGSAGKALMFNEIRIEGATAAGQHGEILIRGEHVTPGYIGRHADLPTTIEGWLHTGDIGYVDEEGYLYVADRRSDLIISGGENIYPAEIENVLAAHAAIEGVGVCAVEDAKWGQRPAAFLVLKEAVSFEELTAFCAERLAKYKIPDTFHIIEELPRNGAGKLMRRKLPTYIQR